MSTNLRSSENNKKVKIENNGDCKMHEVIEGIRHRINRNHEFISFDQEIIKENFDFPSIVSDALDRIKARENKIEELGELITYTLQ